MTASDVDPATRKYVNVLLYSRKLHLEKDWVAL